MTDRTSVPRACTLPAAEQPTRLAEFEALFSAALHPGVRLGPRHLRVTLAGGGDLADAVRDLTDRESRCCSFFTFTVDSSTPDLIRLDIEVPPAHVDVLDALEARATQARGES
jgi:hypothetical protein